ncbi:uncharacterized protein LOC136077156 [Hydra vulgaris]|uniref:Uncharacterized protein LOC136077156 n=1 Tax=Hydra vulgaris TaxID=6087 RepID=A0ABM4BG34_HYDVU
MCFLVNKSIYFTKVSVIYLKSTTNIMIMAAYVKKWKTTNKKVLGLLDFNYDETFEIEKHENLVCAELNLSDHSNSSCILRESDSSSNNDSCTLSDADESYESDLPVLSHIDNDDDTKFDDSNYSLCQKLTACSIRNRWTRASVNELLNILREEGLELPKDARTLLQTPRKVNIIQKCGGTYTYLGIKKSLETIFLHHNFTERCIALCFSIDGLPLYKSSSTQLWPILASFGDFDIFVVALYCGNKKPDSINDYLEDFVAELIELMEHSVSINGNQYDVNVKCFLCDAPAREFLKCIISHTGYDSCERCCIHGTHEGRVVFNDEIDYPLRENITFKNYGYNHHQTSISPLVLINLDMINNFPLDYMHLVCLGVVRRLLNYWKKGPGGKIAAHQFEEISSCLLSLNGHMPSEFVRQPRSLNDLDRWKATEFRQFLLYSGPVVLRCILSKDSYKHFLALSIAISIMLQSDNNFRMQYIGYARSLITQFVYNCKYIYGNTFTVYNIHNLLHLPDDCLNYNSSLNTISCFPYENFLQRVKKAVKGSSNPVAQIVKRQTQWESSFGFLTKKNLSTKISSGGKDNCFLLKNNSIAFVKEIILDDSFLCDVVKIRHLEDVYNTPIRSSYLNIVLLPHRSNVKLKSKILYRACFIRKCVCLPEQRGLAIFPVLHEIERG